MTETTSREGPADRQRARASRAFATIAGWHGLLALGFVGWVLTWPDTVDGGDGLFAFSLSRGWAAAVFGVFLVAPGLCLSFAIACGISLLRPVRRRPGVFAGTIATSAGLAVIISGLAVYALTR